MSVQPEETIKDLKNKIEEKIPRMKADRQKLLHAGKVLEDKNKISSYSQLKDDERIVVMVPKVS